MKAVEARRVLPLNLIPKSSVSSTVLVVAIVATLVLGWLLKSSYEARGALQARLDTASTAINQQKTVIEKLEASRQVEHEILQRNVESKDRLDQSFDTIFSKLDKLNKGKVNVKGTTPPSSVALDPGTVSLLHEAVATAKNYGVSSAASSPSE